MIDTDTGAPASLDEAREQADAIDNAAAPPAPEPDAKPKRARAPRKRAPRKRAPASDRKPRAPRSSSTTPALKPQLEQAITGIGFAVFLVNQRDGQLILDGAARQAAALDALARENPAVRDALLRMMRTSVYAQLAMAFAPTLIGIAANHGMVPAIVGQLVGLATSSPASGEADPTPADPLAGVEQLVDLAGLAGMGGVDGAAFGRVVATDNAVA